MVISARQSSMNSSKIIFQQLVDKITLRESPGEIRSIAGMLMEKVLGLSSTDIMAGKTILHTPDAIRVLEQYVARINRNEPVQYVLGEAHFYGRTFQVNPSVLIPRPETEELIRMVLLRKNSTNETKNTTGPAFRILDIGTGSGCIPITLFLEWPGAEVYASDISAAALSVAEGNAERHHAKINFLRHDILKDEIPLTDLNIIVSNPPYIPEIEKHEMQSNVVQYEPDIALFVSDEDPLIFYREIARKAGVALKKGGLLTVEINERFGKEVSEIFTRQGFIYVEIIPDVSGKERIVKGYRSAS